MNEMSEMNLYINEINKFPLLSQEEQMETLKAARKGDQEARNRAINSNLRLVIYVAQRYHPAGTVSMMDIIQEGNIGLITAVDRFDPDREVAFSTYATWWIRQKISRALIEQSRSIRLPQHMVEKIRKYVKTSKLLAQQLGRDPEPEEVAKAIGVSVHKIYDIETTIRNPVSMSAPSTHSAEDEDLTIESCIEDSRVSVEDEIIEKYMLEDLEHIMEKCLNEKEKNILKKRFGFDGCSPMTLAQIGALYNVTKEAIRQTECRALAKLNKNIQKTYCAA